MGGITPYDLNLRHLRAASTVGRVGSMVAAAELENMSQSALTQAVAKLEQLLGVRLFHRQPNGTVMTPEAEAFLQRTDQALAFIREGASSLRRGGRNSGGGDIAYRITTSQLRALIAVQRTESFTGAAQATGLAQPTIHRAVGQAERSLGTKLFLVSGKMLRTTAACKTFVRFARLAIVELHAALDEIAALHLPNAGRIAIGSLPLARAALLPIALARFSRKNHGVAVQIFEGSYPALLDDLRHGEIDILLGALREPAPAADIIEVPLFSTGLYVVASASHPLAKIRDPGARQLAQYPWIIARPDAPMRDKWDQFFAVAGVELPERVVECGSVVVIRGLLLEDVFLTLLSADQFRLEEANGLLVRIGAALPGSDRRIGLAHRALWRPTAVQARFLQSLHEAAALRQPDDNTPALDLVRKTQRGSR